jgi:hypothetical protein
MRTSNRIATLANRQTISRTAAAALVTGSLVCLTPAAASAKPEPIGPGQRFGGLVNGTRPKAIVKTVCPGPVWKGRTGPIAGGQTLAVTRVADGGGVTGPRQSTLFAWAGQDLSTIFQFRYYDAAQTFPNTLRVPCDGPGEVVVSTCSPVALCAGIPSTDRVTVQFMNIAY